jgi:Glu-tRNA(Gln) amidotransferase subunit E-like FAD-binding protein
MMRCVKCGCSRLDARGIGCVLCGGSPGLRTEQVDVSFATKAKLLASAVELAGFGVTVEQVSCFRKVVGATEEQGVVLDFQEPLEGNILLELVTHLDYLGIPKHEIFRLRLAGPEEIEGITAA